MGLKINAGCGRHVIDGWTNVDVQQSPFAVRAPEYLCDLRKIPLPDECADEVMAIHVFEHFYLWECAVVIAEWHRLLVPGGKIVLELPNIVKCCQNVVEAAGEDGSGKLPDNLTLWGIYGDPSLSDPYMGHHWGWTPGSLRAFLIEQGFSKGKELPTQWHGKGRKKRDMRIEAFKLGSP